MKQFFTLLALVCALQFSVAQRGKIVQPAIPALNPMDPNGDGYITTAQPINSPPIPFSPLVTGGYYVPEFEYKMFPLPKVTGDVNGDNQTGPSCGLSDLTPDIYGYSVYAHKDSRNNVIFRFRLGSDANSVQSWNVLIDTDGKFGNTGANADPDFNSTNPGFELNITLVRKNNPGIFVTNVNGLSSCPTPGLVFPLTSNFQSATADIESCNDSDIFYDFWVPFDDGIAGNGVDVKDAFGITLSTGLRFVATTSQSTSCAFNGSAADIGGIDNDDPLYQNNELAAFLALTTSQCPTQINDLCQTCVGFSAGPDAPTINEPNKAGQTVITGTAEPGVYLKLETFPRNGGTDLAPTWSTIPSQSIVVQVNSLGVWSVTLTTELQAYDKIVASTQFTISGDECNASESSTSTSTTVTNPNAAPVANDQSVTLNEDTPTAITLVATDADAGDVLSYSVVTAPTKGTLSCSNCSNPTYTPNPNYFGADSFTFRVFDGAKFSNTATVSITVTSVNDKPVAANQTLTTQEDTALTITLSATDLESTSLTYSVVAQPANGTLTGTAPNLTYTPAANFNGSDSFTFKANDGTDDSNTATVSITVTAINDAPVASPQSVTTLEDTQKVITLVATDAEGSPLTYSVVTGPTKGTYTISGATVTYTPSSNLNGADSFTFKANDGTADSNIATVSITITPVNDAPVAAAASITLNEDESKAITLSVTDVDGDAITYTIVTLPLRGTLTGTAPNLTYTPAANFNGTDSFTFKGNDGTVDSNTATISLIILPRADPPVVDSQSITTAEDTPVAITLTGSDPDGDNVTFNIITQPAHGTLTGSLANYTYTPAANYNGPDNFTVRGFDGAAFSLTDAVISITVTPVNDTPVANNQSVTTNEDTAASITLTGSDVDGDVLTYSVVTQPTHGTLTGSGSSLTYTPAANYFGPDSFTFKVNDGTVDSSPATISITVNAVNDAPVANSQSVTTNEDVAKAILATASDIDGDPLTWILVSGPTKGTLTGTLPNVTYTPNSNYNGSDSFTFKVNDGAVDSNTATISITVNAVNDAPVANAQSVTTNEDTAATITLTGSDVDGDALTYTVVTQPTNGTLSGTAPNLTYTPNSNYNGSDSFTFLVNDGTANSNTATVSITVTPVNDTPVANAQSVTVTEDTPKAITLTGTDVEGSVLTYVVVTAPVNGTLTGTGANLTYTPAANFNGSDSFTFTVSDGTATSTAATVSITVEAVNDAPVANAQSVTTNEDTAASITLTGSDVEGSTLSYTIVSQPTKGTLTGTAPNVTYTPNADFNGSDSFTFKVNDGTVDSNTATVSITVTPVNDAPVANNQSVTTDEDVAKVIVATATDKDGNTLIWTLVNGPASGNLTGTLPNVTYTPGANFNGSDSFTFKVNDGTVDSNTATISITVNSVNDLPLAFNETVVYQVWNSPATATPVNFTLDATDVDGDVLTFTVTESLTGGVLTGTAPNLTYTPNEGYTGTESFTFIVNDGTGNSNTATVTIVKFGDPVAPVAFDASLTTNEDTNLGLVLQATDANGDPLTYTIISGPANGTLTGTGSSRTYTPNLNFNGTDTFTFRANDGTANSNTATVTITVTAVNDAPVALAQTVSVTEDTPKTITLSATDVENSPLTYTILSGPTNGTLSGTAPNLTYTPNANYNGSDSFTFKANDGTIDSNTATVTINVVPVNDAPVADDKAVTTNEDTAIAIVVTATDTEGSALTWSVVASPANGTLTGTLPNVTYTPGSNFNGTDTFTFKVTDGTADSNTATVTITVTPVNDAPVALAQTVSVTEDTPKTITLSATDVENSPLTYTVLSGPTNGTLSGTAPNLTYTPDSNYTGSDSFTFKANDGTVDSNTATVTINVVPVNDAPLADDKAVTTNEDTAVAIVVTATDTEGSALTWSVVASPVNGTLTGTLPNVTYTPNSNFNGTDTFTFKVNDGTADSNTATVTITVTPVNDLPVANNQSVTVTEDTPKDITLAGSDVETANLTYIIVANPTRGTLSGSGSNITYTPNLNFNGSDSFTFKVNDGTADSNTATVSITVTAVNDAPIASSQFVFTNEDTALPILLFASDADGNALTYAVVNQPQHGTLSCLDCRTPVYTPAANYNGPDSFTFRANDGTIGSNEATINITVNAVNDAPVALNQSITVVEDTPASITLTGTDTEGAELIFTVLTQPSQGVLSGTVPNLTYTPNSNVFGSDSFTFRVSDGSLNSNIATISIVITPVNDLPVANADAATTAEDTPVSFSITANDTDVDGTIDPATVDLDPSTQTVDTSVTIAGQGTLSVDANGLVTFTPVLNYNGVVTAVKYTVKDNDGGTSNEGVISITVTPVNDVPVINATTVSTNEDQSVTVCFTVSDVENDPVTFTGGSSSTGSGTVTVDPASGQFCFIYKPNADFNGTDTIGVGVCEVSNTEVCGTGSITINVLPVNDKPAAIVDGQATDKITQTTAEDTALDFCVDVTDVEGNPISLSEITNVSGGGTLVLGATQQAGKICLSFTPVANFFGASVWTGQLCDDQSGCSTLTFEINVTPVNDIPVAQDLTITTVEDTPKAITLGGTDIDNDPVTVIIVTQPANGTLSGTGAVRTYTPNANYSGPDVFTYKVNDGKDDSAIATVSITVTPVNDAPQIQQVNILTVPEDTEGSLCIGVLDADGDQLTFEAPVNVSGGGTMVTDPEFGFCWIFKSALNYNGNSFWKFKVCDNANPKLCSEITVQIVVTPVNDPPVARNDELTVKSYELSETINLLANDSDIDGDQLQVNLTPLLGPFHAKNFTISAGGAFQYQSALGYIGMDSVKFKVCDKGTPSLCDEATVFIEVTPAPFRIFEGLSPNGDGFNDYWRINGIEAFPDNRVRVLDRYGNLVYDARGYDNAGVQWRGQANVGIGGTLPDDTYYYIVEINDGNGPYSGYVVLKSN